MKKLLVILNVAAVFFGAYAFTQTLVCFTRNEPVENPDIITLAEREIYFTNNDGNASIAVWQTGEKQYSTSCSLGNGMGIGTEYDCGNELVVLDFPNNLGSITPHSDGENFYASQSLVCRDQTYLMVPGNH